jgi:hypothetical protein
MLAGLGQGQGQGFAELTVSATFKTQCTNPAGNVAPGQDSTKTASSEFTAQNGKATIPPLSATVQPPTSSEIKCPNPQWTASVVGQPVITATLTLTFNGQRSSVHQHPSPFFTLF